MRKARFTDEEMVSILREADRDSVGVVAKRHKVSEQAIHTWRKKFGALSGDDVRRLKQLEQENGRLKKLVAERDLELDVMKEIAAKNGECTGPPGRSGVCVGTRSVAASRLYASEGGALCFELCLPAGGEGCACASENE